jgi:AcrR family transcriptional regulator
MYASNCLHHKVNIMSSVPDAKATNAREKILDSAFTLFAEKGYDGTTTKDISALAGVNEVTIFRNFGSKEILFRQVIQEKLPLQSIRSIVDFDMEGPMEEVLLRNARKVLETLKENRHFLMMLVGEIWRHPQFKDDVSTEAFENAAQYLAGGLQSLMDRGRLRSIDPYVAAKSWIGMVQSHYLTYYLVGQGNIDPAEEERLLRGMVDIFINGAGNREVN